MFLSSPILFFLFFLKILKVYTHKVPRKGFKFVKNIEYNFLESWFLLSLKEDKFLLKASTCTLDLRSSSWIVNKRSFLDCKWLKFWGKKRGFKEQVKSTCENKRLRKNKKKKGASRSTIFFFFFLLLCFFLPFAKSRRYQILPRIQL